MRGREKLRSFKAAERLRSLVSKIVLTPENGKLTSTYTAIWPAFWDCSSKHHWAVADGAASQPNLAAGTRGRLNVAKYKRRPLGRAMLPIWHLRPSGL